MIGTGTVLEGLQGLRRVLGRGLEGLALAAEAGQLLHRAVDLALKGDVVARGREYTAQVEGKGVLGGQGARVGDRVRRGHGGDFASGLGGLVDGLVLGDDEAAHAPVADGDALDEVGLHHGGGGILVDEGLVHGLRCRAPRDGRRG